MEESRVDQDLGKYVAHDMQGAFALLQSCRTVYSEASEVLYGQNTFGYVQKARWYTEEMDDFYYPKFSSSLPRPELVTSIVYRNLHAFHVFDAAVLEFLRDLSAGNFRLKRFTLQCERPELSEKVERRIGIFCCDGRMEEIKIDAQSGSVYLYTGRFRDAWRTTFETEYFAYSLDGDSNIEHRGHWGLPFHWSLEFK